MSETATIENVENLLNAGVKFKEHYVDLNRVKVVKNKDYKLNMAAGSKRNLSRGINIEFNDQQFKPSDRFWNSFCAKVGVGTNVFNLFDHDEVFDRIVDRNKINFGRIRVIEDCREGKLLAISDPKKDVINWERALDLIDLKGGEKVAYSNGVIKSFHALDADMPVKIGSEDFKQRISVNIPIDGYGMPSVYLAMLRLVCSNGMVAMSKAFKTSLKVNKKKDSFDNVEFALQRMFDSYSNDEGFDALIRRLDSARSSMLSVREFYQVSKILGSIPRDKKDKSLLEINPELKSWHQLGGKLHLKYGLSHLKEMTEKQMSLLETDLTVYEAVNYMTEVTSHRLKPTNPKHVSIATRLHGWVGSLISGTYDLEGTVEDPQDQFQDLYFSRN